MDEETKESLFFTFQIMIVCMVALAIARIFSSCVLEVEKTQAIEAIELKKVELLHQARQQPEPKKKRK